jgi:hypothetical protein
MTPRSNPDSAERLGRSLRKADFEDLRQRIREAFADQKQGDYAGEFSNILRDNWRELQSSLGKSMTLGVLLMATFVLLSGSAITELSLGPFKVTNLATISTFLPAAVAFSFYQSCVLTARIQDFKVAHNELMTILHKDLAEKHLHDFLRPQQLATITDPVFSGRERKGLISFTLLLVPVTILTIPMIFEIAAHDYLIRHAGRVNQMILISLGVSILLFAAAMLITVEMPKTRPTSRPYRRR